MSELLAVEKRSEGGYWLRAQSLDGPIRSALLLDDAEELSDGRLRDDEATARATAEFLLERQDAADLPNIIQLDEVLGAYEDAVEAILSRRAD
ncbi:MAG TPA: hypothetical protein VHO26_00530 [Propionibacteriaceae bacterium]|nr:hypothetical protein [Propionibacteriaceae bacterium]